MMTCEMGTTRREREAIRAGEECDKVDGKEKKKEALYLFIYSG